MAARDPFLDPLFELSGRADESRSELLDRVLRAALHLVESDAVGTLMLQRSTCERRILRRGKRDPETVDAARSGSELARIVLRTSHPLAISDLAAHPRSGSDDSCPGVDCGPVLLVPMRLRSQTPGTLSFYRRRGAAPFSREEIRLAELLAGWTGLALENRRLGKNLEKLAVTDDLTQVYNYRFLKTALRREIKRAGRYCQDLSIVMIDVDNLKGYNDRNGHIRGSFLLRELAGLLAANVRSWDLVAKYGGDEFTLILPQTDRDGAVSVAERMRAVVEAHAFPLTTAGRITISAGVATFPPDGNDAPSLIAAADRGLYLAKRDGRNRVATAAEKAA